MPYNDQRAEIHIWKEKGISSSQDLSLHFDCQGLALHFGSCKWLSFSFSVSQSFMAVQQRGRNRHSKRAAGHSYYSDWLSPHLQQDSRLQRLPLNVRQLNYENSNEILGLKFDIFNCFKRSPLLPYPLPTHFPSWLCRKPWLSWWRVKSEGFCSHCGLHFLHFHF